MPDANEPLDAILADMREYASIDMHTEGPHVEKWADRIEAAAKRERETAELRAIHAAEMADRKLRETGNVAALHAAISKFLDFSRRGLAFFTSYRYTEDENDEIEEAFNEALYALDAPPRNCDKYRTATEARKAFEAEHSQGIVRNLYTEAFDWLFATAEEDPKP